MTPRARLAAWAAALALLALVPTESWAPPGTGCLWRLLLGVSGCPACGTTHALSALLHGQLSQALAFNLNVALTAPLVAALAAADVVRLLTPRG